MVEVIGIQEKECMFCGATENITRHHVIPQALKPLKNVTIPLCEEHKDITHPTVKQLYVPKEIRNRLNATIIEVNNALGRLKGIKKSMQTHKIKSTELILQSSDYNSGNTGAGIWVAPNNPFEGTANK